MSDTPIFLERRGERAELVFNRPDKRNSLTEAMWRAVPELLADAASDKAVRLLVVRGAGGHFASGADITEFEQIYATPDRAAAFAQTIEDANEAIARFPRPVIAAIEGACVGGGCGLALACDLRFAAEGARFGVTPAKLGLVYPVGETRRLIDAVGVSAAKDLLFTARLFGHEEARTLGLIDRTAPTRAGLDAMLDAYEAALLKLSPASARMTKQMVDLALAGDGRETDESRALFTSAFEGRDFNEGYSAFLAKRPPNFSRDS